MTGTFVNSESTSRDAMIPLGRIVCSMDMKSSVELTSSSSSVSVFIEASGLSHVASCHKAVCFRKSKFHSVWL